MLGGSDFTIFLLRLLYPMNTKLLHVCWSEVCRDVPPARERKIPKGELQEWLLITRYTLKTGSQQYDQV